MKRALLVGLATAYLLGVTTVTPAFAGMCPMAWWWACDQTCLWESGTHVYDPCYQLDVETQNWYLDFCLCQEADYGECEDYGGLRCSQCC